MGLALIPGLPAVELDPELALGLFLPPLLQVVAYRTDWPAFRSNLRPILLRDIGAVLFTPAAVAVVAHLLVPGLPWWTAVALGAIVAPPDSVAASTVLKKFNLPKRIVSVLEGGSLIKHASSLSRPLSDVNAMVFQIKSEMASAAVDPTPNDNFNERYPEIERRLRSVLSDSRQREMARTQKVMSGLELDSLLGKSDSR